MQTLAQLAGVAPVLPASGNGSLVPEFKETKAEREGKASPGMISPSAFGLSLTPLPSTPKRAPAASPTSTTSPLSLAAFSPSAFSTPEKPDKPLTASASVHGGLTLSTMSPTHGHAPAPSPSHASSASARLPLPPGLAQLVWSQLAAWPDEQKSRLPELLGPLYIARAAVCSGSHGRLSILRLACLAETGGTFDATFANLAAASAGAVAFGSSALEDGDKKFKVAHINDGATCPHILSCSVLFARASWR